METNQIITQGHEVYFDEMSTLVFNQFIAQSNPSKIFVLTDHNTHEHCLQSFLEKVKDLDFMEITIPPGEEHKHLDSCTKVWQELSNKGADRNSLLINLGGGVVTDLGGFVASTFKRGIPFINVPTTLLSMVDASIGGKTGVDFGNLKNQIGTITQPKMVLVYPEFLKTLSEQEFNSGKAEMLKHGLIANAEHWKELVDNGEFDSLTQIKESIAIKVKIVSNDPYEKGDRKKLNFGHTLGHAIESFFLNHERYSKLLHGEAIAVGMIMEAYLSHKICGLSKVYLEEISSEILKHFSKVLIQEDDREPIMALLHHDKKNSNGQIKFVLLSDLGNAVVDISPDEKLLEEAFAYYHNC